MHRTFPHLLALIGFLSILNPLWGQDQATAPVAPGTDPAPLQIQDQSVPGMMPPPDSATATPESTPAAPAPADASAPVDTNVPSPPAIPPDSGAPASESGAGSPGQNPPPSDPNSLIPPPVEQDQPSPVNASGNEEKKRQEQKTRYYTAKTQADKEDSLASLLAKAEKAKSDEAKRQTLREYYDLLAKRMKKIDPSISDWIDTMHSAYLRRLQQVRVEPTIPLDPPPAPETAPSSAQDEKPRRAKKSKVQQATEPSPTPAKKPA
jgi:hypothetical protein